jgi:hypothetical protein
MEGVVESSSAKRLFFMVNDTKEQYVYLGEMIDGDFQILEDDDLYYAQNPFDTILDMVNQGDWDLEDHVSLKNSDNLEDHQYYYFGGEVQLSEKIEEEGGQLPDSF